jgi:hypothetical protein
MAAAGTRVASSAGLVRTVPHTACADRRSPRLSLVPISRWNDRAFPPGTLDVRGWIVLAELDSGRVGTVQDLLIDRVGRPLYFEIDMASVARHVLVPLSRVHADLEDRVIWVEGMSVGRFASIPGYALDPATVTRAYEWRLAESYEALCSPAAPDD